MGLADLQNELSTDKLDEHGLQNELRVMGRVAQRWVRAVSSRSKKRTHFRAKWQRLGGLADLQNELSTDKLDEHGLQNELRVMGRVAQRWVRAVSSRSK